MIEAKKLIVLFSSDYRTLYKKDVYNALAYPLGSVMHFRYRLKWLSKEIKDNLPLKDNEVLISAAIILNREKTPFEYKILPLRKGKLISTLVDGDTLHIYFELLADWILYDESLGKTLEYYDNIIKKGDCPSKGKFIAFCNPEYFSFSNESKAWVKIIETLVKFNNYRDSIFYRINNIKRLSDNEHIKVEKFDNLTRGYTLERGNNYVIDITFDFGQEPPEKAENAVFKFESLEDLKIIPSQVGLGFRVDKKQFHLTTRGQSFNIRTFIRTKIENSIQGPELEIPIKIKKNKLFYIIFLIFISSGLILLSWPWTSDTLGTSMRLLGSGLTTLGTFLINYYTRW